MTDPTARNARPIQGGSTREADLPVAWRPSAAIPSE